MTTGIGNGPVRLESKLLQSIDRLAEEARAIVMVAWPIIEEIRAAAIGARRLFGEVDRSPNQETRHMTDDDNDAAKSGLWKAEMAVLLIIGALGCSGAYLLRRRVL